MGTVSKNMGCGGSTYKGGTKRVVIVGGGHAGVEVAKQFAASKSSISITVVSDKDFFDWNFGSPRFIVDPDKAKEACFPLRATLDYFDKDIALKRARVTEITANEVKTEDDEHIPFDVCVVCSGATYGAMPWKAAIGETTWEDRVEVMKGWKNKVDGAKHIVIAGAGIVGVEVAAELGHKFHNTDKHVTLVGSFMKESPMLQSHCKEVLDKYGVNMIPGRTGDWSEGETHVKVGDKKIECDLLLPCTGLKFNGSMMDAHFKSSLDQANRIKCTSNLSVEGATNIFACGDIISIPEGRKSAAAPQSVVPAMATIVVQNAIAYLSKADNHANVSVSEYVFPEELVMRPCVVALGPDEGAAAMPCIYCCYCCCGCCSNWAAKKMKSGDGFIGLQVKNFGKGATWEDAESDTAPGSNSAQVVSRI